MGVLEKHQSFKLDIKIVKDGTKLENPGGREGEKEREIERQRQRQREKCVCRCVMEKWKIVNWDFVSRKKESQG